MPMRHADQVPFEDLLPGLLGRLHQLAIAQAARPRLDQGLVPGRHHELVPELRGEILQEDQAK